jgi:hypothetical protein
MKIEIFKEKKKSKEPEKIVRLRLVYDGELVRLQAVDENGDKDGFGNLLVFYPNGRVRKCGCISKDLGFDLDETGHLKFFQ